MLPASTLRPLQAGIVLYNGFKAQCHRRHPVLGFRMPKIISKALGIQQLLPTTNAHTRSRLRRPTTPVISHNPTTASVSQIAHHHHPIASSYIPLALLLHLLISHTVDTTYNGRFVLRYMNLCANVLQRECALVTSSMLIYLVFKPCDLTVKFYEDVAQRI